VEKQRDLFTGWASLGLNSNDNEIGLGKNQSTPADIDDERDTSAHLSLGLNWLALDEGGQLVQLGYRYNNFRYSDLTHLNTDEHTLQGIYSKWLLPGLLGSAVLSLSMNELDSERFLNRKMLRLGVSKQLSDDRQIGGDYSYTDNNFKHPALTGVFDRDGQNQPLGVHIRQSIKDWSTRAALKLVSSGTRGNDFESDGVILQLSANRHLGDVNLADDSYPIDFTAYFGLSTSDYDGVNSLSSTRRGDDNTQLSLGLSTELRENWTAAVSLSHLENRSNIAFYEYDRTQFNASVSYNF
jgi:hypothetical protein